MKVKIYRIVYSFKNLVLMMIHKNLVIDNDVQIRKTKIRFGKVNIGKGCRIGRYVNIEPSNGFVNIGEYTSINSFSIISGAGGVSIGKWVAIAPRCSIIASNHVFNDKKNYIKKQGIISKSITIEDDVWLGTGVIVLAGVTIGKGSVIGAGSVVTKDIPQYSVAVGVPAKVIKTRGNNK